MAGRQEMRSEGRTLQIGAEGLGKTLMEGKAKCRSTSQPRRLSRNLIEGGAEFPKCGAGVGNSRKREGRKPVHHPAR